jgi:hypothetical protein
MQVDKRYIDATGCLNIILGRYVVISSGLFIPNLMKVGQLIQTYYESYRYRWKYQSSGIGNLSFRKRRNGLNNKTESLINLRAYERS